MTRHTNKGNPRIPADIPARLPKRKVPPNNTAVASAVIDNAEYECPFLPFSVYFNHLTFRIWFGRRGLRNSVSRE